MANEGILISELARRAKVSVRTIRYYISEGLLPPPQAHGRYSVYDEEYLDRIELIKRLKDAFLPLKEIRRQLETLTKEEIAELLQQPLGTSGAEAGEEAEEGPGARLATGPAPAAAQARVRDSGLPHALDYIANVLKTQPLERIHQVSPAAPAAPPGLAQSRSNLPSGTGLSSEKVQASGVSAETHWVRLTIVPGLELHASEEAYRRFARRIQEWIETIKQSAREELAGGKNV
jgi:DNA-binding transcriptional MerR regulator